jgi:hypothetical protein
MRVAGGPEKVDGSGKATVQARASSRRAVETAETLVPTIRDLRWTDNCWNGASVLFAKHPSISSQDGATLWTCHAR